MKAIQIRDVDEQTYEALKASASAAGVSLTAYLRRHLDRIAGDHEAPDATGAVVMSRGSYDAMRAEVRRLRKLEGRQQLAASIAKGGPVKSFRRDELAEAWGIDA
jgi:hypothetical protein